MKKVVYKAFSIGQHEKEEQWLNAMSAHGWQLSDVGLCRYVFLEGPPGEYIYRLELLNESDSHPESTTYLKFLEETGVEHVGTYFRWVYLRRKAAEGPFELYSDIPSKITHLKRITWLGNFLTILLFVPGIAEIVTVCAALFRYFASRLGNAPGAFAFPAADLFVAVWYLLILAVLQLIVLPVRRSLKKLKEEQKVRE